MAIYGKATKKSFSTEDMFMKVYVGLTYISGVTYFLSTCINPFLYNLMSHKFRNASKVSWVKIC
jgi:neuromedin U receptor 1